MGYGTNYSMDEVTVLLKELPHPFCLLRTQGRKGRSAVNQEAVSPEPALLAQIWGFQPPEPWAVKLCCS